MWSLATTPVLSPKYLKSRPQYILIFAYSISKCPWVSNPRWSLSTRINQLHIHILYHLTRISSFHICTVEGSYNIGHGTTILVFGATKVRITNPWVSWNVCYINITGLQVSWGHSAARGQPRPSRTPKPLCPPKVRHVQRKWLAQRYLKHASRLRRVAEDPRRQLATKHQDLLKEL